MNTGRLLALGVLSGRWTLEGLDRPSPGLDEIEADRVRSALPADVTIPADLRRRGPVMTYPGAGSRSPHRNLAREWIAAHPQEWAELQRVSAHGLVAVPTQTGASAA